MKTFIIPALLFLATSTAHAGGADITSSVLDGSGSRSSGGTLENISAAGQPGGIQVSEGGALVNYAGFLNTFSLKPNQDTDNDGLVDELDTDNDNDGLTDISEITGDAHGGIVSSNPNQVDSDSDGVTDDKEAVAQTDPTDTDAFLNMHSISENGQVTIQWRARAGKTYTVYKSSDLLTDLPGLAIDTVTVAAGGTSPWFVVTNIYPDVSAAGDEGHYYVEALP